MSEDRWPKIDEPVGWRGRGWSRRCWKENFGAST